VRRPPPGFRWLIPLVGFVVVLAAPTPAGLTVEGQRVLAVVVLAIGLWGLETVPAGVTGVITILGLVLTHAVTGLREALVGFADPIAYFLIGVLTMGVAVAKSGLAERVAHVLLAHGRGSASALYAQLLLAMPPLTLILPSATTRTAILVHVYDQALELGGVPPGAPLSRAVMLALNSVNRLSSTILLTGGITPIVAAGLIGTISWTRWFVLMSVPYATLLVLAAAAIYLRYRAGFAARLSVPPRPARQPLSGVERRTALIVAGAGLLWLTDAFHHLHPTIPALLAFVCFLLPGIGVLTWRQFEQEVGWTNFFVIGASLSLAQALARSGASAWLAAGVVGAAHRVAESPGLVVGVLIAASAAVRLMIPNITGYLATTIPVAMSVGTTAGLNPVLCGLIVTIAGDAVLYYPAQSASSLVVYERGHLTAGEIFHFGLLMTALAALVVVAVALPYWALVGEPLVAAERSARLVEDFADLPDQLGGRERLAEEQGALVVHAVPEDGVLGVAGHVEDAGGRAGGPHAVHQLTPAHARHHHVGQHHVDVVAFGLGDAEGLHPVARLEHRVALALQDLAGQRAHVLLVLHQQDRLVAGRGGRRGLVTRADLGGRFNLGQEDLEGGAAARHAADRDRAAVLAHHAVHHREAEPGALAGLLRGEKRFKDAGLGRRVHAHAGVHHPQDRVRSGGQRLRPIGGLEPDVGGLDAERAPSRHRVACVHREIEQHLLELARVGVDASGAGAEREQQVDVLADEPPEDRTHLAHRAVEVEDLPLQHLLAAEGQELAGEPGRAIRSLLDQVHVLPEGIVRLEPSQEQCAAPGDDGEEIVEVVGDPAREAADRFHLLGLA
jgi:sodium-dependent dicarboxylate transporter 2/3/5